MIPPVPQRPAVEHRRRGTVKTSASPATIRFGVAAWTDIAFRYGAGEGRHRGIVSTATASGMLLAALSGESTAASRQHPSVRQRYRGRNPACGGENLCVSRYRRRRHLIWFRHANTVVLHANWLAGRKFRRTNWISPKATATFACCSKFERQGRWPGRRKAFPAASEKFIGPRDQCQTEVLIVATDLGRGCRRRREQINGRTDAAAELRDADCRVVVSEELDEIVWEVCDRIARDRQRSRLSPWIRTRGRWHWRSKRRSMRLWRGRRMAPEKEAVGRFLRRR